MPHDNHWEDDNLYRKFSGEITGEEILESNFELHSHPNFKSIKYIINDFTDVTGHSVEIIHTNVYANVDNIIANSKGKLKIALIVPVDSIMMEVAENYRKLMIGSVFTCEIFSTVEEANHWINED